MSEAPRYVPGEGPSNATYMIVGEAPGFQEEKVGRPFIGPSGNLLRYSLDRVGIPQDDVYITNLCHFRPPNNKINKWCKKSKKLGYMPNEFVRSGMAELYKDISTVNPKVIIPVGNLALWALTGLSDISRRRGSIYQTSLDLHRVSQVESSFANHAELDSSLRGLLGKKLVPTFHPAAVLRMYNLKTIFEFDLKRAKRESTYPELNLPQREIFVDPEQDVCTELVEKLLSSGLYAADIETPRNTLYCAGFSCDPSWALVLRTDQAWKRALLQELFENKHCDKVFHNGGFDTSYLLYHNGWDTQRYTFDTMYAHKLIYGEFRAGLDFLTSFYTDEPYYKDEGKDQDLSIAADAYEYMRYCGKDACVTMESCIAIKRTAMQRGSHRASIESHMGLLDIVKEMTARGLNVDQKVLYEIRKTTQADLVKYAEELDELVFAELLKILDSKKIDKKVQDKAMTLAVEMKGRVEAGERGFNVNSNKDTFNYLYDIRQFKEKKNKITKARTADEKALKELYGETGDKSLLVMVKIRTARKILSSYVSYKFAPKGRFYYSVNPVGTKTARWSSGQTIVVQTEDRDPKKKGKLTPTGANAQTLPPNIRRCIIPDKGYLLGYADLSAVEDRIVSYKANISKKIHAFENDIDVHSLTASGIFNCSIEEVIEEAKRMKLEGKTPPRRYMGKQSNHAFNYNEFERTFMLNVNKKADETGIRITLQEARTIRKRHFNFYPEITHYHDWIEEEIRRTRTLKNPFGYERQFYGRVPDNATFRDGFSWYPQSTAPEIINRGMVRIRKTLPDVELLLHVHDAILFQVREKDAEQYKPEILRLMDEPLYIDNHVIHIPVDMKLGERWSVLG